MKKIYLIAINLFLFGGNLFAQSASVDAVEPALQKKYLPNVVQGIYINMPFDELTTLRPNINSNTDSLNLSIDYLTEKIDTGNIAEITYQVSDANKVYEMIFQYSDTTTYEELCSKAEMEFGRPNSPEDDMPYQWKVPLQDGLTLMFWIYENKFCIADASKF